MAVIRRLPASAGLSRKLGELTENREKRGLALRPPKRLLRLLHLVKVSAASVAFRPISFGNRSYLEDRVKELRILGEEIQELAPELRREWRTVSVQLCRMLDDISVEHGKTAFSRIAFCCDQTGYREFWKRTATYVPIYESPLIRKEYERVVVVTGPGIGLGDEISCAELVRSLRVALPNARFDFHGFYTGFWSAVEPGCDVYTLTGNPVRVFDCVEDVIAETAADKVLVVYINFGGVKFHLAFCIEKTRPDVLEIAVGRGAMWFSPGDGGPIQYTEVMDPVYPDNYGALRKLSFQLLDSSSSGPSVQRVCGELTPGFCKEVFQVIVSPFTSKQIFLSPQDWTMILRKALGEVAGRKPVSCVVLAGLSDRSAEYALQIADGTRNGAIERFDMSVMGDGSGTEPDLAFRSVYDCMRNSDLVIGIDTYTAHLAAILSVPSVALCYERNVAFWADAPNSIWIEIRHDLKTLVELITVIFSLSGGLENPAADALRERLKVEQFVRLDEELASLTGDKGSPRVIRKTVEACDAAWDLLPTDYRTLISKLDYNYAWPRISSWICSDAPDTKSSPWLLEIAAKSHFRKVVKLIANLGRR